MTGTDPIQAQVFSGHESFPLRFTWLTKAVRGCEKPKHRTLFSSDDAMVRLGVGKNMVRSIRFWGMNTAMLADDEPEGRVRRHCPTKLGAFLFGDEGRDPFMEDPATIWLLHWQLPDGHRAVFGDGPGATVPQLTALTKEIADLRRDILNENLRSFTKLVEANIPYSVPARM